MLFRDALGQQEGPWDFSFLVVSFWVILYARFHGSDSFLKLYLFWGCYPNLHAAGPEDIMSYLMPLCRCPWCLGTSLKVFMWATSMEMVHLKGDGLCKSSSNPYMQFLLLCFSFIMSDTARSYSDQEAPWPSATYLPPPHSKRNHGSVPALPKSCGTPADTLILHKAIVWDFKASLTITGCSPWNWSGWNLCKINPKWVETGNVDQLLACRQLLSIKSSVMEKGIEPAYGFPVFSPFPAFLHRLCSAKSFLGLFNRVISVWQWLTTDSGCRLRGNFFPYPKYFSAIFCRESNFPSCSHFEYSRLV